MFCYAQINEEGICEALIESSQAIEHEWCIQFEKYDESYLNKKYDVAQQKWTDEYVVVEVAEQETNKINDLSIDEKLNNIMVHLGLV